LAGIYCGCHRRRGNILLVPSVGSVLFVAQRTRWLRWLPRSGKGSNPIAPNHNAAETRSLNWCAKINSKIVLKPLSYKTGKHIIYRSGDQL
jgi:hypothetical protein